MNPAELDLVEVVKTAMGEGYSEAQALSVARPTGRMLGLKDHRIDQIVADLYRQQSGDCDA